MSENFSKKLKMYHVQVEVISTAPEGSNSKYQKHYARASFWAEDENEIQEQLKEIQEIHGPIRQAWITKYNIQAERWPLLGEPNNIKE